MQIALTDEQHAQLEPILNKVNLSVILDHISASYFEAADSCDGEARDTLMQQAACVSAAALFSKQWCE